MTASLTQLFDAAREMPEADRAALSGLLLESLDGSEEQGVQAAWAKEIEQRVRELDGGSVTAMPWDEVRKRLPARHVASR